MIHTGGREEKSAWRTPKNNKIDQIVVQTPQTDRPSFEHCLIGGLSSAIEKENRKTSRSTAKTTSRLPRQRRDRLIWNYWKVIGGSRISCIYHMMDRSKISFTRYKSFSTCETGVLVKLDSPRADKSSHQRMLDLFVHRHPTQHDLGQVDFWIHELRRWSEWKSSNWQNQIEPD